MAWSFGDGFDLYAAAADMVAGYWDSGLNSSISFTAGRFSGSRSARWTSSANTTVVKSSGVNDAVHHLVVAFQQTSAISGTTLGIYLELFDGATAQCSIVFKNNGDILLTSGGPAGTVLATYTGAVVVTNTWYQFEFEVIINNTTGSFKVRKNGNSVDDFSIGSLNTRPTSTNNYANKLQIGMQTTVIDQGLDDFFWRSDASAVAWLGDIRCYTRMPASDQSVTFSKSPASYVQTPAPFNSNISPVVTQSYYMSFIAAFDGTVSTVTGQFAAGYTGNVKCSVLNGTAAQPTTIVASATTLANPVTGVNTFTFPTPFTVVKGAQYWVGFATDTAVASSWAGTLATSGGRNSATTGYSAFPAASPTMAGTAAVLVSSWTIAVSTNNSVVNEAQQDALTSYVFDSTPGDADFYGIASIASTPASVIATTVRAYAQKSDAGTRTLAAQLKSGATTVASPTLTLTTSGWQWAWRTDTVDPATGAAWTPAAVNNAQIGPRVVA